MLYHVPALLNECINGLNIRPDGIYVDVTFGGGGHSKEILKRLDKGRLIAFDQDENAERNKLPDKRFLFINQNFRFLKNNLRYHKVKSVNGLLADLGVSFHQFDEAERGFAFRYDADLDMRMNKDAKKKASDIVNDYTFQDLKRILHEYGEFRNATRIASAIIEARDKSRIMRTAELKNAVKGVFPEKTENKHLARLFQAIRIELNREMEFLKEMLEQALDVLDTGGRLSVITYHSIEDRIVKNFFRTGNFQGEEIKDFYGNLIRPFKLVNKKVITPGEEEMNINKRARSAKLRIAEKL